MGSGIPGVNFGSFNHGPSKNDPVYDAWVKENWRRIFKWCIKAIWWYLRIVARFWYYSLPLLLLGLLLDAPGDPISWLVFLPVTAACVWYRLKVYKPKVIPVLSEEEQQIQQYAAIYETVMRNSGLHQKRSGAEGVGVYRAYLLLASTTSADQKLREAAYGTEADTLIPELLNIRSAPLGFEHVVKMLPGMTVDDFSKRADILANEWGVTSVRVTQAVPGQVLLTPVIHDPLSDVEPITADNVRHFNSSLKSVQIGLLEDGTAWNFPLDVHSIVAGNSGGGKSVAYRAILSQMALLPDLQIIGIDLKRGIELKSWRPRLSVTAKDMDTALDALHEVWEIAEQRLDFLEERGFTDMKDYGFSPEMPRIIVLIDECSELFAVGESDKELARQGKEAIALVSKMLRLVRAAGITILMATQRPSVDVVPSSIRELTQNRVAFRMMNSAGTIMALGELPENSISPVDIAQANKGRAVVADDQGNYSFAQCRFIEPETAKFIAEETSLLTKPLAALALTPGTTDNGIHTQEGEII